MELNIELNEFHSRKIEFIRNYDFSLVEKYAGKALGGVTATYLKQGIDVLKQFYILNLLDPLNKHVICAPLDSFWDSHVLLTKDYMNFCEKAFGFYLEHDPIDSMFESEQMDMYKSTVSKLSKIFKDVDLTWWPVNERKCCGGGGIVPIWDSTDSHGFALFSEEVSQTVEAA